ncbi:MAG: tyrosine-type recombinase/integrase [Gammaproteobacteria bacterium]|nr:tyrosine-type recombinase/integrase [Gammaproteobacteria bacterium]NNJ98072.1 tyrosine-type recombinase/integrase [Gammaproteobacteria bacterium]
MRHKRHAYATHQLAAGMPIHQLKEMLGHSELKSTERY